MEKINKNKVDKLVEDIWKYATDNKIYLFENNFDDFKKKRCFVREKIKEETHTTYYQKYMKYKSKYLLFKKLKY
jgi:hypothetical protein